MALSSQSCPGHPYLEWYYWQMADSYIDRHCKAAQKRPQLGTTCSIKTPPLAAEAMFMPFASAASG